MAVKVIVKDHKFGKVMDKMRSLGHASVVAGFRDPAQALKATRNEFGTLTVPSRPFLRNAYEHYNSMVDQAFEKVVKDPDKYGWETIGKAAVDMIRRSIKAYYLYIPNTHSTLRRKLRYGRGDKPLIDTGEMLNSVVWEKRSGNPEKVAKLKASEAARKARKEEALDFRLRRAAAKYAAGEVERRTRAKARLRELRAKR